MKLLVILIMFFNFGCIAGEYSDVSDVMINNINHFFRVALFLNHPQTSRVLDNLSIDQAVREEKYSRKEARLIKGESLKSVLEEELELEYRKPAVSLKQLAIYSTHNSFNEAVECAHFVKGYSLASSRFKDKDKKNYVSFLLSKYNNPIDLTKKIGYFVYKKNYKKAELYSEKLKDSLCSIRSNLQWKGDKYFYYSKTLELNNFIKKLKKQNETTMQAINNEVSKNLWGF